jgi:hypothetical protein
MSQTAGTAEFQFSIHILPFSSALCASVFPYGPGYGSLSFHQRIPLFRPAFFNNHPTRDRAATDSSL